jgi:hypothetical protein
MGRYYNGDIEGKFWFGVQSSDAAQRFGGQMCTPQYLEFYFCEDDLKSVNAEILAIETKLGDKKRILEEFFNVNNGYNDKMIADLGITREDLEDYADLKLGIKIKNCIIETGECNFEGEL